MVINIIEKKNRRVLCEGRDNGMAFGFLERADENTFHTVQPLSPCKDYLAEVVFTECYDIPTKGCGLSYPKKLGIFTDCAYLAIKMMKTKGGRYSYSNSFENDVALLAKNYKNIERLLNEYEKTLGLVVPTTIEEANDGYFLVRFSSEWCKSTHSISLYTLLLRVLMVATDKDNSIMPFLAGYTYHNGDKSFIIQVMGKISLIAETKTLPPNNANYSRSQLKLYYQSPHNNGIVNWKSSFEDAPLKD